MGYTNLTAIDAAREFLRKSGDVYKTKHLMYLGPDTKRHIDDGKDNKTALYHKSYRMNDVILFFYMEQSNHMM